MHPAAILLILGAALSHAGWNLFAKRAPDGGALFVWLATTLCSVVQVPIVVISVITHDGPVPGQWWLAAAVTAVLHLGYFVLLQRGYAVGDLSVVYPLARGTGPMLSVIAAIVLLGERPGPAALAGAAAVVFGVFVIGGLGTKSGNGGWAAGAWFGIGTGAMIAVYTLWDAHAVTTLAVPPLVLMGGSIAMQAVLVAPYALARRAEVARIWRTYKAAIIVVAVLSPLAYVFVLFALRLAPVSLVAPARELSIVLASLGAWLLLGEPNPKRRLTGAVIVLAGVAAIAAS